ncbi:MAG: squalene synthase HpnC [Chloroflexi bacterium]|nr:squalene synthase HpnC [Chloroflexota bacterium]
MHDIAATGSLDEAFALCERLAKTQYENFSLATRLMPARLRRHFYAVYAFCRGVDDLGDKAGGDRMGHLAEWEHQLRLCYAGQPSHPYFVALQQTIARFDIPAEPFLKLIEANRRDQRMKRHPTYAELLEYCEHSANPVGRIVLYVLGHRGPDLHALSDHTCTALQLANFWQDIRRDYDMGRIYLPVEDLERFSVREADIASHQATPQFRALMRFEVDRARDLFVKGVPLIARVRGFARVDLALFTAGGLAVLRMIERQDYDVLNHRPALSKWAKARLFAAVYLRTRVGLAPIGSVAIGSEAA